MVISLAADGPGTSGPGTTGTNETQLSKIVKDARILSAILSLKIQKMSICMQYIVCLNYTQITMTT